MAEQILEQRNAPDAPVEPHPVQAILRFLRAVYYRKGIVIVALAASCLLGGLYYATVQRVYESKASLLILQTGDAGSWSAEMSGGKTAKDLMVTYKNMLRSETVAEAALKTLPAEHRDDLADAPRNKWVKIIQGNLAVSTVRDATILNLAYQSKDPDAAKAIVTCILFAYLDFMDRLHKNTADELLDILTKEKVGLEDQMHAKQNELIAVRRGAEELIIRDGDQGDVIIKEVMSLNETWIEVHKNRLNAQSHLAGVEAAIRNREDLVEFALTISDAMGGDRFLHRLGLNPSDSHTTARLNQQLSEDRAKLQSDLQLYLPAHHRVREIQERIRVAEYHLQHRHQIRNAQLHQLSNADLAPLLLTTARQHFAQAAAHENLVRASYEEAKRTAIGLDGTRARLDMLQLDWNRLQRTYEIVQQRLKDIDLGQKSGTLRTSILSPPEVPTGPVWPRKSVVAVLAILFGLGAGLAIVYLQDLLDDRFRSPEELRTQLSLPVLAMVGKLETLTDRGMDAVHAHVRPNAAETEAFRTLRTALALAEDGMQRLVVSSSEPGDGKTTVIVNLATAYAQSGKRTLLIDADMRRPGLTPLLDLKGQRGLSTILREQLPLAEAASTNLYPNMIENLDVLPAGPRPVNPTELLAGDRFSELLSWAETRYDQILIDSPPALVSDTAIIGRLVDGVLLTVLPEKNRRRAVIRAAESFPLMGIKVLGIVVNRIGGDKGEGYCGYSYGYGYGYGGYGYGYGYGGYGHDEDSADAERDHEDAPQPSAKIVRRVA